VIRDERRADECRGLDRLAARKPIVANGNFSATPDGMLLGPVVSAADEIVPIG